MWNADKADELLLIFTHIDPNSHLREFYLGMHAEEDNTYHGTHYLSITYIYVEHIRAARY